ncbi:hypothetical protein MIND_01227900 [Mycena indigotica]|uniref:Uncharacterized protein n=1 Tax=Mycena indigotica TaxID=2126181 RepID=A0A8H6VU48_9AGAR|nr:uncharacterized protein MIND_01227900 [Mycena indigotica]KAF7292021.1 hypothetical protein MIND_01227900 [Mycena indigotica]
MVHPALKLSALEGLPPPLRHAAKTACKANATASEMQRPLKVGLGWIGSDMPPGHRMGLLPLCYVLLDPALIPTVDALETRIESGSLEADKRLLMSQDVLYARNQAWRLLPTLIASGRTSPELEIELWPRFWAWFQFFESVWPYYSTLPSPERETERTAMIMLLLTGTLITVSSPTRDVIRSTPGFYVSFARAWKRFFPLRGKARAESFEEGTLQGMIEILDTADISDQHVLHELLELEGVGGSFQELTECVMALFDAACGIYQVEYRRPTNVAKWKRQDDYAEYSYLATTLEELSRQPPPSLL